VPPLKVLHVAGSAEWAGGEVYLLQLAERLDRARFSLSVVCPAAGPLAERLERAGVSAPVIPMEDRLVDPSALRALTSHLRRERPHIVQSHGARANFYGRLAARFARVPRHLSTVHNSLYDYPVPPLRRALYLALDRVTVPWTETVVCVAESLARDLIERSRLPPRKVRVIPNGVDLARFDPARADGERVRRELGLGAGPVLGIIGRMTLQKDHQTFLAALAVVRAAVPEVQALIVGDGPLRKSVEAQAARLGLERACRFTGVRDDIPDCLAAASVVVLSSVSEGFPFTVLEALALARPLVATAVNGVTEIVEPDVTGLLVPPRRPDLLARATLGLLDDPERARGLGQAGRKAVEARFPVELMITRLEHLYAEAP
jgi:glycosyltransferase involved in cell wall biosynthesis